MPGRLAAADAPTHRESSRSSCLHIEVEQGRGDLQAPGDIQFAKVHDCISIVELLHIEDLGFFKPGVGYKAVAEGATRLDGPKPINTSGGLKCKGHPVGATGTSQLYEVWTQLRGKAGKRQVPIKDLCIGGAHNLGGTGGTCTFTILERR
jgi:acetyl-CoA C-acetyltransferase